MSALVHVFLLFWMTAYTNSSPYCYLALGGNQSSLYLVICYDHRDLKEKYHIIDNDATVRSQNY